MILIDTSVWIDHLRKEDATVAWLLEKEKVLSHPSVIGEIAIGSFKRRDIILSELNLLPSAIMVRHEEVLRFISNHRLFGLGIGYVDVHLLASALLTPDTRLWTRDRRLGKVAETLKVVYLPFS